jgi:hypothetical protein
VAEYAVTVRLPTCIDSVVSVVCVATLPVSAIAADVPSKAPAVNATTHPVCANRRMPIEFLTRC